VEEGPNHSYLQFQVEVQKVEEGVAPSWVEEAGEPLHLGAEGVVTLIVQGRQERQVPELELEHHSTADT
jgi:hypothetical protein